MRTNSKAWKLPVVAALAAAVLTGGCSPQMKKAGYVGGAVLLVGGVVARTDAESSDHELEDLGPMLAKYYFGTAAAITGAIVIIAALVSPSESKAPAVSTSPVPPPSTQPPATQPPAMSGTPRALVLPPKRVRSPALSMRGASSSSLR